jgi:hypothetical protein
VAAVDVPPRAGSGASARRMQVVDGDTRAMVHVVPRDGSLVARIRLRTRGTFPLDVDALPPRG